MPVLNPTTKESPSTANNVTNNSLITKENANQPAESKISKPVAPPRPHAKQTDHSANPLPIIPQVSTVTMPSSNPDMSLEDQLNLLRSMYEEEKEERIKLLNVVRTLQKRVDELSTNK
jgi:hypothetical protein